MIINIMIINPEEYYSVNQAAQYFGVKHFTIRSWIHKNKLKSIKIGNHQQSPVRIKGSEILKLETEFGNPSGC